MRIKRIGAVGAVFEQVLFCPVQFITAFILTEAVATTHDTCCLNGKDKVVVVLMVEERHRPLLAGKAKEIAERQSP